MAEETAKKPVEQKSPATQEDALAAAAERIRETAKWLVAAFAAVGGLLITGMQLKDLGALEGTDATLAAVGAGLGIAGVLVVLLSAAAVLAAGRIPMADLTGDNPARADIKKRLQRNRNLYQPFDDISEFDEALAREWREQTTAFISHQEAAPGSDAERQAEQRYLKAGEFLEKFNPVNRRLLAAAEYENVRSSWDRLRKWILVGVVAAAVGSGMFGYSTPPDEEPQAEATVPSKPARAFLHLSESGREEFADVLGKECEGRNLPAIALSRSASGSYDLVTDPSPGEECAVARIEVSDSEGEVTGKRLPPFSQPD